MDFELRQAGDARQLTLHEGVFTVGGDPGDDVPVPSAPAGLLQLWVEQGGWCVIATHPVKVSNVDLPPFVRRRVLPGERVVLPDGTALSSTEHEPALPSPASSTRSVALALIGASGKTVATAPSLLCLTGLDLDRAFPLGLEPLVIGRSQEAAIRLRDRAVSRLHAQVSPSAGRHRLQDLGGTNAVQVNGAPLDERRALEDGDIVSLGFSQLRYCRPLTAAPPDATLDTPPEPSAAQDDGGGAAPSATEPEARETGDWPWMAAGATLVALGTYLGVALA